MEEQVNEPLARYTTLRIGGPAGHLYQPHTAEELTTIVSRLQQASEPWHILGGGSNLLVSSRGVSGSVIRTAQLIEMKQLDSNLVEASAGVRLPHLARFAASLGLAGLEFSVGIPGTVGGAVVMNAGAHGGCMADVIESVLVYDALKNSLITLNKDDLTFSYRRSTIDPSRQVVISARLKLHSDAPDKIETRIKANEEYRLKTQPIGFPNAGSTFVNPEPKRGAGFLLDQAGAKGMACGQAAVSTLHANFVINLGQATSQDATDLLKRMQDLVYKTYSLSLHPEWKTLGEFTEADLTPWK